EAPLGRPAEVIAVEVAGERLARAQVNDPRLAGVARMVHLVPVAALGDLLPAALHALKVARPGEWITRNRRMIVVEAARVLHRALDARDTSFFGEDSPRHVGIEGVPGAAVLDFAVGVAGERAPPSVHPQRLPVRLVPGMDGAAQGVGIGEAGPVGVVAD